MIGNSDQLQNFQKAGPSVISTKTFLDFINKFVFQVQQTQNNLNYSPSLHIIPVKKVSLLSNFHQPSKIFLKTQFINCYYISCLKHHATAP